LTYPLNILQPLSQSSFASNFIQPSLFGACITPVPISLSPLDSSAATRTALFTVGAEQCCQIAHEKHTSGLKNMHKKSDLFIFHAFFFDQFA